MRYSARHRRGPAVALTAAFAFFAGSQGAATAPPAKAAAADRGW